MSDKTQHAMKILKDTREEGFNIRRGSSAILPPLFCASANHWRPSTRTAGAAGTGGEAAASASRLPFVFPPFRAAAAAAAVDTILAGPRCPSHTPAVQQRSLHKFQPPKSTYLFILVYGSYCHLLQIWFISNPRHERANCRRCKSANLACLLYLSVCVCVCVCVCNK